MNAHIFYRPASFRVAAALSRALGRGGLRALAALLGAGYWAVHGHYRSIVAGNLARVVPDDPPRRRALTRRNFLNFARSLADYCALADLPPQQFHGLFAELGGREHLDAARRAGRGAILATAHLGNWELGGLSIAAAGYPLRVVTAQEPSPELHAQRRRYRAAHGIQTVTLDNGSPFSFVEALAALRENCVLAMLVDRPYGDTAVDVDFFGGRMKFSPAPIALAQTTGAPILPAYCVLDDDGRYRARVEPPLALEKAQDPQTGLRANTQRLAAVFERIIREHPDQWFQFLPLWKE